MAFEGILAKPDAKPARWRKITLSVSLVVHAIALVIGIIYSIWRVDEVPMPAIQVLLTEAPPPPPPPPPPAAPKKVVANKPRPKPVAATSNELVAPSTDKEALKNPEPEPEPDHGIEGGFVGGAPPPTPPPPPPPPKPVAPKTVTASVGHHQLAINANAPPYCCVKIPRALERSGVNLMARVRVCVSADGRVNQVQVVEGAGSGIDPQIPSFVSRWRYRPYLVDGVAAPFCYTFRYEMTVR